MLVTLHLALDLGHYPVILVLIPELNDVSPDWLSGLVHDGKLLIIVGLCLMLLVLNVSLISRFLASYGKVKPFLLTRVAFIIFFLCFFLILVAQLFFSCFIFFIGWLFLFFFLCLPSLNE